MSHRSISNWKLLAPALLAISMSVAGCGPPPEPTGGVEGTVKSRGKICGECQVLLHSLKGTVGCEVGESGDYEFNEIPYGDYKLTVFQKPSYGPTEVFDRRIPNKYRNTKSSGLSVSITAPEPIVFDIDME